MRYQSLVAFALSAAAVEAQTGVRFLHWQSSPS